MENLFFILMKVNLNDYHHQNLINMIPILSYQTKLLILYLTQKLTIFYQKI